MSGQANRRATGSRGASGAPAAPTVVSLAPLVWVPSPNHSSRHGTPVTHLVWHATAGAYRPSIRWLCDPTADASCHLVIREDGLEVTQLVALEQKAWHAFPYWNLRTIGVEHASPGAGFYGRAQFRQSARVFAWLCHRYAIPPLDGLHRPKGLVYHRELGATGGGHGDGPEPATWLDFLERVALELERGGFRRSWAR